MARRSIRFRLTIWYALALTCGLLLFAAAIWLSAWHMLSSDIDQLLRGEMSSTQAFLTNELEERDVKISEELAEYSHALPRGTFVRIGSRNGRTAFSTNAEFPWSETPRVDREWGSAKWHGEAYRTYQQHVFIRGDAWQISFATSLENMRSLLRRLTLLLLALTPLIVAMAALGGRWLSRRALKPVDEITDAARRIGIKNLSERLIIPPTGDELERLSETWNSMLARLEDAVNRLSRFTSDASHELRTPLAVIRSTAEIAARKSRSADAYRKALEQIVIESERMTTLVDDLLFLARSDAENLQLPMEPIWLDEVVNEVYSLMSPVADFKGIRLAVQLKSGDRSHVSGNHSAIRRLLLILVDNALKYSNTGGAVTISVESASDKIHVKVTDSGPGIPTDELPLVFQRFYRGHGARDSGKSGYGLGLALARGIAQHHRSTIQVSSRQGQGSVFDVAFPLCG